MALSIDKRNAGCAAVIEDKLYIWGGETTDTLPVDLSSDSSDSDDSNSEDEQAALPVTVPVTLPRKNDPNHPFDVFNISTRTWSRQPTSGSDSDIPSVGNGSNLTYHPDTSSLYLYAGWNEGNFDSEVYRVSVDSWKWLKVSPATEIKPTPRYHTAVVLHGSKLCHFGGVGPPIIPDQDEGAVYIMYEAHGRQYPFGWNNEYYEFDVYTNTWKAPLSGTSPESRPPPVGAHVFTKFDKHRAVYFGGRRETGYTNDAYIFDLDSKVFSKCQVGGDVPLPCPRVFPTLVSLVDPHLVGERLCGINGCPLIRPRLLLLWGKKTEKLITNEAWIFEPLSCEWSQIDVSSLNPRSWHITQPCYQTELQVHQPGKSMECQTVVFGGNAHITGDSGDREDIAELVILSFGLKSLHQLCLLTIISAIGDRDPRELCNNKSFPPKIVDHIISVHSSLQHHIPTDLSLSLMN